MKKWQQGLAATAVIAMMTVGGSNAFAATTTADPNPAQNEPAHHQGPKKHLTPEQKETLKQAGVDFKEMHETSQQIHDVLRDIRANGQQLKAVVKDAPDSSKLDAQIRADLEDFRQNMRAARELHLTNRQLTDELRQAVDKKETAKIKEIYAKMVSNQKKELQLVQKAHVVLQAEVKKVQVQVKKS